jgi:hypothetical protein
MVKKMDNTDLALELFNPNEKGISRWVKKTECIGKYSSLYPKNGNHWYRNMGLRKFIFEKRIIEGDTEWRFNGMKDGSGTRSIRTDIRDEILKRPCVITGLKFSRGHKIEVDHRDGRYPENVLNKENQKVEDFQPLLDSLNKQKRSDCAKCVKTGNRFDAREKGCSIPVTEGSLEYEGTCVGCYWYDPKKFLI